MSLNIETSKLLTLLFTKEEASITWLHVLIYQQTAVMDYHEDTNSISDTTDDDETTENESEW